jgi:LysM repeat protein
LLLCHGRDEAASAEDAVPSVSVASTDAPDHAAVVPPAAVLPNPATTVPSEAIMPVSPAQTGMPYIVKSGDTLFGIARASGCTVKALKSINSLASERLMVGHKLRIPESRAQVASVTRSL